MKILVICQHYWPEPYRLSDICEELVKRGHTVRVVTDVPNYPKGKILPGYRFGRNRWQLKNGVTIHRTFTIGRRNNMLFRFFNYYSFSISSSCFVRRMKERFDVVLAYQTSPVMMSNAALVYGRKHRVPVLLYCMDLWPSSLRVGGIREDSPVYRFFHRVSKRIYRGVDQLLVSSRGYADYLSREFGIDPSGIAYLPQYADNRFEPGIREPDEGLHLVFAGNVGTAQSIPTILQAAKRLRGPMDIVWHIAGDGSALDECRREAVRLALDNVIFHGYLSGEALGALYRRADAMLVTMAKDDCLSLTLPMKIMSYMASGKPIIAAADGEIPRIIGEARCGYSAQAEDPDALAEAVLAFALDPDRDALGRNAEAYYEAHFAKERFLDALESRLTGLAERGCGYACTDREQRQQLRKYREDLLRAGADGSRQRR